MASTRTASGKVVSRAITVAAPAERVFDLLADPAAHPRFDGSGTVRTHVSGPTRLRLGDHFTMRMRLGVPYLMRNTVVEYVEGARIAWRHVGLHRWRFELEPVDGGTRVTETFDYSDALLRVPYELLGVPERNARSIEATLARLKVLAEQPEPGR